MALVTTEDIRSLATVELGEKINYLATIMKWMMSRTDDEMKLRKDRMKKLKDSLIMEEAFFVKALQRQKQHSDFVSTFLNSQYAEHQYVHDAVIDELYVFAVSSCKDIFFAKTNPPIEALSYLRDEELERKYKLLSYYPQHERVDGGKECLHFDILQYAADRMAWNLAGGQLYELEMNKMRRTIPDYLRGDAKLKRAKYWLYVQDKGEEITTLFKKEFDDRDDELRKVSTELTKYRSIYPRLNAALSKVKAELYKTKQELQETREELQQNRIIMNGGLIQDGGVQNVKMHDVGIQCDC